MKRFTKTRTRKVLTATVSTLLICAAAALAYYLVNFELSGESTATLGEKSSTIVKETFSRVEVMLNGSQPGANNVLEVQPTKTITLTTGAKLVVTFTTLPTTCLPAWFRADDPGGVTSQAGDLLQAGGSTKAETITAGSNITGLHAEFISSAESQTACEKATVTAHVVLTGTGH
jgi:hypothetical protein